MSLLGKVGDLGKGGGFSKGEKTGPGWSPNVGRHRILRVGERWPGICGGKQIPGKGEEGAQETLRAGQKVSKYIRGKERGAWRGRVLKEVCLCVAEG